MQKQYRNLKERILEKEETVGVILVLISVCVFGIHPILSKYAVEFIHPLFLGTTVIMVASIVSITFLSKNDNIQELIKGQNIVYLFLISLFGTLFTSILFFFGATMTSGINVSLLLQIEPIYAIFLGFFILKEHISNRQILATFLIISGVIIIVYNGTFALNLGDVLIISTPMGWQISHIVVKRVSNRIGTYVLVTGKFLYAGIILLIFSTLFGTNQFEIFFEPLNLALILLLGTTAVIGYILWLEAIKRINVSKATVLISPYPIISVIFAWFILSELPSIFQIIGLIAVIIGIYLTGKIKSELRQL